MRKLIMASALILVTLTLGINAATSTTATETQKCEKCGDDGKGGMKCAPGKCGKGK